MSSSLLKGELFYAELAPTQECDYLLQFLIHANLKQRFICMRKEHALNGLNGPFLSDEDQMNIYPLWDNEYLKMRPIYKPKALKTEVVDLSQTFLSLLLQHDSFMYTLVRLYKALKTPWTLWEKRTKCCFYLCVCNTILF